MVWLVLDATGYPINVFALEIEAKDYVTRKMFVGCNFRVLKMRVG